MDLGSRRGHTGRCAWPATAAAAVPDLRTPAEEAAVERLAEHLDDVRREQAGGVQ